MTKPEEAKIHVIKQKTTPEKHVDFVIPDDSDSRGFLSDDDECSTRGSNNH